MGIGLCLFTISNNCCLRVNYITKIIKEFVCFIYRGLDNKLTLYPLSTDDEANKHKKVVATHANYISACKFMHSDQQVRITNRMHLIERMAYAVFYKYLAQFSYFYFVLHRKMFGTGFYGVSFESNLDCPRSKLSEIFIKYKVCHSFYKIYSIRDSYLLI